MTPLLEILYDGTFLKDLLVPKKDIGYIEIMVNQDTEDYTVVLPSKNTIIKNVRPEIMFRLLIKPEKYQEEWKTISSNGSRVLLWGFLTK